MPRRKEPEPPWQIILEEIRSQNRTTIEVVESTRRVLEARIDHVDDASRARDEILELAIRDLAGRQDIFERGQESLARGQEAIARGQDSLARHMEEMRA